MDYNGEDDSDSWVDEEIFDPSDFDQYVITSCSSATGIEGRTDIVTPAEPVKHFGEDPNDSGGEELKDDSNHDIVKSSRASAAESSKSKDYGRGINDEKKPAAGETELFSTCMPGENELEGDLCEEEEEEEETGDEDDEKKRPAGEKEKCNVHTTVVSKDPGESVQETKGNTTSDEDDEIMEQSWVEDVWVAKNAHLGRGKQEVETSSKIPSPEASDSRATTSEGKKRERELISALEKCANDKDRPNIRKEFKRQLLQSFHKLRALPHIDVEEYTRASTTPESSGNISASNCIREYRVKVYNFHLKDMVRPAFPNVIFLAESVTLAFAKHEVDNSDQPEDRVLDMLVHRHNIPEIMVLLHSFEFFCNPVAFEVWRIEHADLRTGSHLADISDKTPEMEKEKVVFKVKKDDSLMPCNGRSISGSALKKSLVLNNLPANTDEFTLRIIFPKAVKIGIAKVSRTIRSAVIEMSNTEDVWHFLNICLELQIEHREISMKAMDAQLNEAVQKWKKTSMPIAVQGSGRHNALFTGRSPHDSKVITTRVPLPGVPYPVHEATSGKEFPHHGLVGQGQNWTACASLQQWTPPNSEGMSTPPAMQAPSSSCHSSTTPAFPAASQPMNRNLTASSVPVNVTVNITGNSVTADEASSSAAVIRPKPDLQLGQDAKKTFLPAQESKEKEIKKPPLLLRALRQKFTGIGASATKKESSLARVGSLKKQETDRSDQESKQQSSRQTDTKAQKQEAGHLKLPAGNETSGRGGDKEDRRKRGVKREAQFTATGRPVKTDKLNKDGENRERATMEKQKQWQQLNDILEKKRKEIEKDLKKKQEEAVHQRRGRKRIMVEPKRETSKVEGSVQRKKLKEEVAERSQGHVSRVVSGGVSQRSKAQNDHVFKKPAPPVPVRKSSAIGQMKQNLDTSHPQAARTCKKEQKTTSQHLTGPQASGSVEFQGIAQNPAANIQNPSTVHLVSTSVKDYGHQKLVPLSYQPLQDVLTGKMLDAGQPGRAVSMAVLSHVQQAPSDVTKLTPGMPVQRTSDAALPVPGQPVQQSLSHSVAAAVEQPTPMVEAAGKAAVKQLVEQGMARHQAIAQMQQAMAALCKPASKHADLSGTLLKPCQAKNVSDHHHRGSLTGQADTVQQVSSIPVLDHPNKLPQQPMFARLDTCQPVQDRIVHRDTLLVDQPRSSDAPFSSQEVSGGGLTLEDAGKLLVQQLVQQGLPLDAAVAKVQQATANLLASRSAGPAMQQSVGSSPENSLTARRMEMQGQRRESSSNAGSGILPVSPVVDTGLQKTAEARLSGGGDSRTVQSGRSFVAPIVSSVSQTSTNTGLLRANNLNSILSSRETLSPAASQQSTSSGIKDDASSMLSARPVPSPAASTASQQPTNFRLSADAADCTFLARQDDLSAVITMSASAADYRLGADNLDTDLSARFIISPPVSTAHLRSSVTYRPVSLLSDEQNISSASDIGMQKTPNLGMLRPDRPYGRTHLSAHCSDLHKAPEFSAVGRDRLHRKAQSSSSGPGLHSALQSGRLGHDRPYSRAEDVNCHGQGLIEQKSQPLTMQAGCGIDRQLIKDQLHRHLQEQAEHLKKQMALLASLEKMPDNLLILPEETSGFQLPRAQRRDDIQWSSVQGRLDIKGKADHSREKVDDDDMGGHFDRSLYGHQVRMEQSLSPVHPRPWQNTSHKSNVFAASLSQKRSQGRELLMALPDQDTLRGIQGEPAGRHLSTTRRAYAEQTCSPVSLMGSESVERHRLASFQNRISRERARDQLQPSGDPGSSFPGQEAATVSDQSSNFSSHYCKGEERFGQKTWVESSHHARAQRSTFNRRQNEDLCHRDGDQRWSEKDKRPQTLQESARRNFRDQRESGESWDSADRRRHDNERCAQKTSKDRSDTSNQRRQK